MLSNFSFLAPEFSILANIGESAEFLLFTDPASSLSKLRLFGEKLTELLFEKHSLAFPYENNFHYRLLTLKDENILPATVKDILFLIKKVGNRAVHDGSALERDAKDGLRSMFNVARWFSETYAEEEKDLSSLFYQEPTYVDTRLALQKLEEDYRKLEKRLNDLLAERDTEGLSSSAQQVIQQRSERAARKVEMSEAQTRELIDLRLREAGWEVDTETINFKKNRTLPETGKNKAIAEWPAGPLWADYALFIGTELYGFVEAKRYNQDISTDLRQSKVYAERVKAEHGATLLGQWGAYQVPFLFSTNGRPYLKQIETKSGIWFLDARQPTNHAKALQGWYSPQGLINLRERDIQQANEKLQQTPLDFLESKTGLGLRKYQIDAIRAVENHIIQSPQHQKALVAMATGTGKTRTIIGLCYHLIQTNRFSRILFLVDRTLLGTQASEAFKDNKVADLNTFADIYEVKGIKHVLPGPDTRLHFATVQGMVKRLFYNESEGTLPSVDQYDCIIIDEAHRGYLLDKDIDEEGLNFKNQLDYVSKYRMVLDYFDAYAIALTATPALHTTEIFGKPIYTYSYREAVIDGYLIDHDPPLIIRTTLNEEGIAWQAGERPKVFDAESNTVIELDELEDELQIDIAGFNRQVLTENFNRTVVKQLVQVLDPDGDEKTLIFAATDEHADRIVQYLKEEFRAEGILVADDAIQKITGKSYNPQEQLTRFKNEKYPTIAVTVDLLTTGIDVPAICNIVFMRRVKSRILYEQMLGRATRRCDTIKKEVFRIYDAVRLYEALEEYTSMKPVVANPNLNFSKLVEELPLIESNERASQQIEQLVAKLQRKKHRMRTEHLQDFQLYSGGETVESLLASLLERPVADSIQRITALPRLWTFLDTLKISTDRVYVSEHEDTLIAMEPGYGLASRPEDYLNNFTTFLKENQNRITALNLVVTRPAELTRLALKDLLMTLAQAGYEARNVKTALKAVRNEDIGADIISIIRTLAIGSTLESHEVRIKRAVNKVRALTNWNKVQQKWIDRFEKQLLAECVLQLEDLNQSPFSDAGGVEVLNKVFDDKLPLIIQAINQQLYQA